MTAIDAPAAADDGRLLDRPAELGRRRPVLSFVGVIALVALVLLVVGRSGVLAPQAEIQLAGWRSDDAETPLYTVANHGWRPIEVERVSSPTDVRLDHVVVEPFTLAGGADRTIAVPIPCQREITRPLYLVFRVTSIDSGMVRTLRIDAAGFDVCP